MRRCSSPPSRGNVACTSKPPADPRPTAPHTPTRCPASPSAADPPAVTNRGPAATETAQRHSTSIAVRAAVVAPIAAPAGRAGGGKPHPSPPGRGHGLPSVEPGRPGAGLPPETCGNGQRGGKGKMAVRGEERVARWMHVARGPPSSRRPGPGRAPRPHAPTCVRTPPF